MQVGLIGTGRMGQAVASLLPAFGHEIGCRCNRSSPPTPDRVSGCQVLIDFSAAEAVPGNVQLSLDTGIPLVCGTTGWQAHEAALRKRVLEKKGAFLFAPNFSLGVALFSRLVKQAAHLFSATGEYDFAIHESHHAGKADSPSGTALLLAKIVMAEALQKRALLIGNAEGKIAPEALQITSTRAGAIPGTHRLIIDGAADTIELTHTARSRDGFARGAIRAAEWLVGKTGYFGLDDMLDDLLTAQKQVQS